MVPPASDKISRVSPYSGSFSLLLLAFRLRGFHPLRPCFRSRSAMLPLPLSRRPFYPDPSIGLGSFPFARRYSGNHCCFLFLRVLRCFSSPGSSLYDYLLHHRMTSLSPCRVPPFGYRRVFASLQLGAAFRSSVRPSSVSSGQASSVRPCLLDQLVLLFLVLSSRSF